MDTALLRTNIGLLLMDNAQLRTNISLPPRDNAPLHMIIWPPLTDTASPIAMYVMQFLLVYFMSSAIT